MNALFVVPFPPAENLPELRYPRAGGGWDGGFSVVGLVPFRGTCVVSVDSSPATIAAMRADPIYNVYPRPLDTPPSAAFQAGARAWFIAHGAPVAVANAWDFSTWRQVGRAIRAWHGVAENEGVDDDTGTDIVYLTDAAGNQLTDSVGNLLIDHSEA